MHITCDAHQSRRYADRVWPNVAKWAYGHAISQGLRPCYVGITGVANLLIGCMTAALRHPCLIQHMVDPCSFDCSFPYAKAKAYSEMLRSPLRAGYLYWIGNGTRCDDTSGWPLWGAQHVRCPYEPLCGYVTMWEHLELFTGSGSPRTRYNKCKRLTRVYNDHANSHNCGIAIVVICSGLFVGLVMVKPPTEIELNL